MPQIAGRGFSFCMLYVVVGNYIVNIMVAKWYCSKLPSILCFDRLTNFFGISALESYEINSLPKTQNMD